MDELTVISEPLKCHFCKMKVNDATKFGPLYKLGKVRAHYFCVLLSHGLIQNGSDEEGMLGFLLKDIKDGLRRTKTTMCTYCGKKNASIICSGKKCPKKFHLPCGLENGSLHQFMNEFKSFCRNHRPVQTIPGKILKDALQNVAICCICYERVEVTRRVEDVLWAPCCRKTWYHRHCVQKLAHSAGYFFKCAACNDTEKFKATMERFGIYVPQQDASWERVPNAFAELLHRHDTCDAAVCKCPDGRQKDEENTIFEIILCRSCGAQGVHVLCGGLSFNDPDWECDVCRAVVTKSRDRKRSREGGREMKGCLFKAGKGSSGPGWPPAAEEGASESKKVGTNSTGARDADESGKGESRERGEVREEEESVKGEIMEEEQEVEVGNGRDVEEKEKEEVAEEEEKWEAEESVVILIEEESGELLEEGEREEEKETMEEQEYVQEQERVEGEESVVSEESEEEEESSELIEVEEKLGEEEESEVILVEDERREEEESRELIEEQEREEEEERLEDEIMEEEENKNEHEKIEAEESVVIIDEEEEEEEELREIIDEHENGEEEGTVEHEITEEREKDEEGGTSQEQERGGGKGKREEASLVWPRGDSSLGRKRRRSFEEPENSAAGKRRRKIKTTCREEQDWTEEEEEEEVEKEDESVIDVESLSEKWKDAGTQTETAEEDPEGVEKEPGEPKTSKGVDIRDVEPPTRETRQPD